MSLEDIARRKRLIGVAQALARIEVAVEALAEAHRLAGDQLPYSHGAMQGLVEADTAAKKARAKLALALERVP